VWGVVRKLGRSRGGVGEEWGRGNEWSSVSGERAARRQRDRGERGGKRWGSRAWGCHGAWPRSVDGARQRPERGAHRRRAPRVACRPDRAGREGADGWAAAQYRAVVPLTGGSGLLAGAVESTGAYGSAREESRVAEPR
jgi:hypothetical protein